MSGVYSILVWVTALLALALVLDGLFSRRWPLAIAALWNATLLALLTLVPAIWLLPRWELALLPAEIPAALVVRENDAGNTNRLDGTRAVVHSPTEIGEAAAKPASSALVLPKALEAGPVASSPPRRLWDLAWMMLVVYVLGVSVSAVRLVLSVLAVFWLRKRAMFVESPLWRSRFETWRGSIAPNRNVALLQSADVAVPIVLGWRKPAIVVPQDLVGASDDVLTDASRSDTVAIDAVLVHELAHIERADCGWQLVERTVQVVYWFHPLVWLARRRIAQVRERACDDFAVHQLRDPHAYAETLVAIAARIGTRRRLGLAMAVVRTSHLERRLAAIAESVGDARCRLGRSARWSLLATLLLIVAGGATATLVRAQPGSNGAEKKATQSGDQPEAVANEESAAMPLTLISAADKLPKWQQERAGQFHVLIQNGKFDEAAALFAPELRKHWPGKKLRGLFDAIALKMGPLRNRSFLESARVGNSQMATLVLTWGKQILSVRLSFNDGQEIDGIWFAQHWAGEPISGEQAKLRWGDETREISANGLALGKAMAMLVEENLSLVINLVDGDGASVKESGYIAFYRALNADESPEPNDWQDATAGVTWRFISNESREENRADYLAPGAYRAFLSKHKEIGYQLSDPIKLDGSQKVTTIELRAKPNAAIVARVVDAQTGEGLKHFDLRIQAEDPGLPSYRYGSSDFEEPEVRVDGLLPGRHRVTAFRSATKIGERDYEQIDVPQYVDLEAGKTAEITVKLRAAVMTDDESAQRWPFEVKGRVVDNGGKAVEGARISAWSGIGTQVETGQTTSDAEGRYTLRFGPGYWTKDETMKASAFIRVNKPGLYDSDLLKKNRLSLVNKLPPAAERGDRAFLLPNEAHELNFVLAPAVGISAEFEDPAGGRLVGETVWLSANLPRLQETVASGKTSPQGSFGTSDVAPRQTYQWSSPASPFDVRSNPFEFPAPGNYRMVLQMRPDTATGSRFLKIKQVVDTSGHDVTAAVVKDDPTMREPLPAELQTACHEIVTKMLAANRLWLEGPPADVKSYQFDVHFDAVAKEYKPQVTYQVDGPDSISPQSRHGIMYASPLLALNDRQNVVYRALDVNPEETTLAYTFKKPARIAAGNGVEGFWRGSITAASREGIVRIDSKRNVPLEVQGDVLHEHFENYREVATDEFAPQRIRIDRADEDGSFGWGFDWKFEVYEPRLWLLSESRDARTPNAPPVMMLDKVKVNGEPARRLE